MRAKIAVVVPGRFHAFHLVRELLELGQDVTLLTNYPKGIVVKYGIPKENIKNILAHGILSRIIEKINSIFSTSFGEAFLHCWYGRWAARQLKKQKWDFVHVFSGVAEEILIENTKSFFSRLILLGRFSSHIQVQFKILNDEEKRLGKRLCKPSAWMIQREVREYSLSKKILLLSNFSKQSFMQEGTDSKKLIVSPLGSDLKMFYPKKEDVDARYLRIKSRKALRVLMVGTLSMRKGAVDLSEIVKECEGMFDFKFVGGVLKEAEELRKALIGKMVFVSKLPENSLPAEYLWADIFVFPTLEDGYAVVLAQALACGLPVLTTPNSAGPELVREGKSGWILPIRSSKAFAERLRWCDAHRNELAHMAKNVLEKFKPRDWSDVAKDFSNIVNEELSHDLKHTKESL